MKKLLCLALTAVLAFSAVACGSSDSAATDSTTDAADDAAAAESGDAAAAEGSTLKIGGIVSSSTTRPNRTMSSCIWLRRSIRYIAISVPETQDVTQVLPPF